MLCYYATMERSILGKGWSFPIVSDLYGNIALSSYEKNVEESIKIILNTTPGERVMNPDFGCKINELVFSTCSPKTVSLAVHYVEEAIIKWEPRVILKKVEGEIDINNGNLINIKIDYEIRSVNTFFNMVYPFYLERGERDSNTQLR